ncbi:hypothetical protein ONS95_008085 [Cadophora gregata]|uniref:uncharacterized protein n=1 Tax=Cadophora gregata TaxID=51156 RepID=UPI0026DAAC52|nr:uncharacterized protein ONS95_008085 [Cadophora gregata]KAK0126488.1 hypothetical protein ONS95_008085 [Cadophora gregata]
MRRPESDDHRGFVKKHPQNLSTPQSQHTARNTLTFTPQESFNVQFRYWRTGPPRFFTAFWKGMAASSTKKGWLTSLVPPATARARTTCRFINARPITYLTVPQISFASNIRRKPEKAVYLSTNVESQRVPVRSSTGTSLEDHSNRALLELANNISTLSLNVSSDGIAYEVIGDHTSSQGTSSRIQGLDTASTDRNTQQQSYHGPIHFHRRSHKNIHSHNILSDPSPLTSDCRKYAIPKPHSHPPEPLKIAPDPRAHIRPSTPEPISPTTIKTRLAKLVDDQNWDTDCAERERRNPFPHLDQNSGWNRAFCAVKMYFSSEWTPYDNDGTLKGALEEMTHIKRCFARFSLRAQREAMVFDEEDLRGENGWGRVFDVVFRGEGVGLCWARSPGSWHAVKPGLLTCCRSVSFYDEVLDRTEGIRERVRAWRALQASFSKRRFETLWPGYQDKERFQRTWLGWKATSGLYDSETGVKRVRLRGREPEKIASEKWCARRREQEKKAGRWLDGTIRQDRLWAEFHWVLNEDDPRQHMWPGYYRYYYRNGLRYWYRI